jgi:hypothetical protein
MHFPSMNEQIVILYLTVAGFCLIAMKYPKATFQGLKFFGIFFKK